MPKAIIPPEQNETESQTRITKINVSLEEAGWKVRSKAMVWEEADTLQSDFRSGNYLTHDDTYENEQQSRYADYLLLDSKGNPLAVIEAKKDDQGPSNRAKTGRGLR